MDSSRDRYLDRASLQTVTRAALPLPPPAYAGKTLHMTAAFCYTIDSTLEKAVYPADQDIVNVTGMRVGEH